MSDWNEAREILSELHKRYSAEWGKAIQKMLVRALERAGHEISDERTVEGVDIDTRLISSGEGYSFEVKATEKREIYLADKDVRGLAVRERDGYSIFYAVISLPLAFSHGWIIAPAKGFKPGNHSVMSFIAKDREDLSKPVNEIFPEVVKELGGLALKEKPESLLSFLKKKFQL